MFHLGKFGVIATYLFRTRQEFTHLELGYIVGIYLSDKYDMVISLYNCKERVKTIVKEEAIMSGSARGGSQG